jgi:hypothetical protein
MGGARARRRGFACAAASPTGESRRGEAATPYLWLQPQHLNRHFFNLEIGDWMLDIGYSGVTAELQYPTPNTQSPRIKEKDWTCHSL